MCPAQSHLCRTSETPFIQGYSKFPFFFAYLSWNKTTSLRSLLRWDSMSDFFLKAAMKSILLIHQWYLQYSSHTSLFLCSHVFVFLKFRDFIVWNEINSRLFPPMFSPFGLYLKACYGTSREDGFFGLSKKLLCVQFSIPSSGLS